jgi:hypothetical protein
MIIPDLMKNTQVKQDFPYVWMDIEKYSHQQSDLNCIRLNGKEFKSLLCQHMPLS